jgi:hypothetical protein
MVSERRIRKAYAAPESGDAHLQRLLAIYDIALDACVKRDPNRLEAALDVLESRIDYAAWLTLGMMLCAHLERARQDAREGNFLASGRILAVLRDAWSGRGRIEKPGARQRVVPNGLSVRRIGAPVERRSLTMAVSHGSYAAF